MTNYFYDLLGTDRDDLNNLNLLEKVCSSKRFSNIIVNYYISKDNLVENKQFSAVTFFLETGDIYIAYRGTDVSAYRYANPLDSERMHEKSLAMLQDRLDKGLISMEEFNAQLKRITRNK